MTRQERETNTFIEWILCLTLGYLGVHKFYAGKKKMGIIYLFTAGLCGIGWIVDLIALTVELLPRRDSGQKASQLSENRTLTEENFSAVGVCYYESNIRKLACKNAEWSSRSSQIPFFYRSVALNVITFVVYITQFIMKDALEKD